jgi:hypothetical protein
MDLEFLTWFFCCGRAQRAAGVKDLGIDLILPQSPVRSGDLTPGIVQALASLEIYQKV